MFHQLMILLADAQGGAPAAPAGQTGAGGLFDNPMLFLLVPGIILFYFLFLRPMQRQEKEKQSLLNAIKKNDKVITHAGIYGTVISVAEKEDEIVVKVDDNVRVKMVKNAIMRNLTNEETAKEAEVAKKAAKGAKTKAKAESPASTAVTTKDGGA